MSKIKICAFGGLNEEGKNMYMCEVDNDIYIFDAGLKYADDKLFGIDYVIPNMEYLKNNRSRIKGIFLSHAHLENIGAIPNIVDEIPDINIYGGAFTIQVVSKLLEEYDVKDAKLNVIKAHQKIEFEPNSIFPISLTHSVPDSFGYVLYTLDGAIVYTGNFVFDPTMRGAYKTDIGKLAYVGKQGVLCLLSESRYAGLPGFTSPNHRITSVIKEAFIRKEDRIIFNVFTTNIYRIQELFNEVLKTSRKVVIMGKTLQNLVNYVIDNKYVFFDKSRIGDLSNINDKDVVILISSENERPFVNLEKIISGYDKFIKIKSTDTVVFLEPVLDGMELVSVRVSDNIARIGADIVTLSPKKYLKHHASSEDLMLMLDLINPRYYFPVIGEYRYQVDNAGIASRLGIRDENIILRQNGEVVEFVNGKLLNTFNKLDADPIMIDGTAVGDIGELVLKDREMLSDNGILIISATLDKKTKNVIAGPEILTRGFIYVKDNIELIKEVQSMSLNIIKDNTNSNYVEFNKIKNIIRDEVGKYLYTTTECKPMIITVISEV